MLPGKTYKPEDYLWAAWTRKWFIIIPTLLAGAGTFAWSWQLPDRYLSSTTILVIPQRVPETYVRSTVTATVAERLQTIQQQILSRTRLERIIDEFKLYPAERQTMIMEDVVELMRRRDIKVFVDSPRRRREDTSSFSVGFESTNPRQAMQVADRLANMFVQENLTDREVLADSTSQFLQAQLEDARRRLLEHEGKLEAFKERNAGQLPGQVQSNLQMMQMTQSQIQQNAEALVRDQNRLSVLEGSIADAFSGVEQPLGGGAGTSTPGNESAASSGRAPTAAQQLAAANATLQELQRRGYKPDHPDIGRLNREIARLEPRAAEEAARAPETSVAAIASTSPGLAQRVTQLRVDAEQLRKSIESRHDEDDRLKRALASYRSRFEMAPQLESELTELMRDYETIRDQYTTLLKKSEESKLAVNLERRQIGEQFRIIDGARLPERPTSPNRTRLNAIGLLSGLGFGIALVFLLEYRDTKLRTDEDVVTSLALPVLAVIPAMVTGLERRRSKRRRLIFAISTSVVLALGVAVVIAWRLQWLGAWVR
jgi:polysaccharide chain length determinant protein (PEP-CTERM system associated)